MNEKHNESKHLLFIMSMALAAFIMAFSTTSLMAVLPKVEHQFRVSLSSLEWLINGYTMISALLIIPVSRLGDIYKRTKLFNLGLMLLILSSIIIALTNSFSLIVIMRCLQGVSAALIIPTSLAMLKQTLPENKHAKAIAVWSASMGLSMGVGPVIGGFFSDLMGWQLIFYFIAVVGIIIFATSNISIDKTKVIAVKSLKGFDFIGVILFTFFLVPLTWLLMYGEGYGWSSYYSIVLLVFSLVLLIIFVVFEKKSTKSPIIDFKIFSNLTFLFSVLCYFISFFIMEDLIYFFNIYSQNNLHYSSFEAGSILLFVTFTLFLASFYTPKLLNIISSKKVFLLGFIIQLIGSLVLILGVQSIEFYGISLGLILLGASFSITSTLAPAVGLGAIEKDKVADGSGIISTAIYISATFGIAIATIVYSASINHNIGFQNVLKLNIVLSILGGILAIALLKIQRKKIQ
ncbi:MULTISPECIES: MFS transporter [Cysteiniphilum]|uniref:MFS transporter n=1 Tax=Cysteiniphilum TaxID=2056696 RepID=UPI00177FDC5A|nr:MULTISPECIES: MFS transporter [Cysteiniphilum]